MPDKVIQMPDGKVVSFPGSMSDDAISAVIKGQSGNPPKVSQDVLANLAIKSAQPTQFEQQRSGGSGFLGNMAGFFGDLATINPNAPLPGRSNAMPANVQEMLARNAVSKQAAAEGQARQAAGYNAFYRTLAPFVPGSQRMEAAAQKGDTSGVLGAAVAPVAAYAATKGISAAADALPSETRAAGNFQKVMQSAGDIPIDTAKVGETALRADALAKAGGSLPKVVRDFLKRVTDPEKGPITYSEARDFYTNATRISFDESNRLTPVMKRQLSQFTQDLGAAIAGGADQGGVLPQYQSAMSEYAKAKKLQASKAAAFEAAKNALIKGAPIAGAAYGAKKIIDAGR